MRTAINLAGRALSCLLAVVLAAGLTTLVPGEAKADEEAQPREYMGFSDVRPGDWYATDDVLGYAVDSGLLSGYPDGTFGPYDPVTRGQVMTVLWRMTGSPSAGAQAFDDVDYTQYYGEAVLWARDASIVSGYGNTNTFGPDDPVTREQLAAILSNYAREVAHLNSYSDCAALDRIAGSGDVSSWARTQMGWAVDQGIISGELVDGTPYVNPQGTAQRCAFAKMISVLHGKVLGLEKGDTLRPSQDNQIYQTGDTVVLTGILMEEWWNHLVMGPQQSYILDMNRACDFAVKNMGSVVMRNNVTQVQLIRDSGSLPNGMIGKKVKVIGSIGDLGYAQWHVRQVLVHDTVVTLA